MQNWNDSLWKPLLKQHALCRKNCDQLIIFKFDGCSNMMILLSLKWLLWFCVVMIARNKRVKIPLPERSRLLQQEEICCVAAFAHPDKWSCSSLIHYLAIAIIIIVIMLSPLLWYRSLWRHENIVNTQRIYKVVFFAGPPKKTRPKCQTLRKFWRLELFWWDSLCNLTLRTFKGRPVKKNTLYVQFVLHYFLSN